MPSEDRPQSGPDQAAVYISGEVCIPRDVAAEQCDVKVRTVDLWIRNGKVRAFKRKGGNRRVFVVQSDIDKMRTPEPVQPVRPSSGRPDLFEGFDLD